MSFIDQMSNLRDSLEETKEKTATAVRQIKNDSHQLRHQAQNLVRQFALNKKAQVKILREDLKKATSKLKSQVKTIRKDNIDEQKERRKEFAQARAAFWQSSAQLMGKKSN